jgi:hypothetical protein
MTWASITERGTLVDLFQMDEGLPSLPVSQRGRGDARERDIDARIANMFGCGSPGGTGCSADLNEVQHEATKSTRDARRSWSQAHVLRQ